MNGRSMHMVRPQAQASVWSPSLRERVGNAVYDVGSFFGLGGQANRMRQEAQTAVDFLPILGSSVAANESGSALRNGDYIGAALLASGAIPGAAGLTKNVTGEIRDRLADLVFGKADEVADMLRQRGVQVGEISRSTNRHGENSAYLNTEFGRVRISDHPANPHFRAANEQQFMWDSVTPEALDDYVERERRLYAEAAERSARAKAELAAREAPYIERFRAAKEHERADIIRELYPRLQSREEHTAIHRRWRDGR